MAGGSELRSSAKWQLRCANERTERGKQHRSSQRCSGGLGELGEAPEPTNLTKMAGGSEVEDEPGEVVRGLLEGRGSVRWVEDGVAELVG